MASAVGFASTILVIALTIGTLGYHFAARFSWLDSFLNASMISDRNGPRGRIEDLFAKIICVILRLVQRVVF